MRARVNRSGATGQFILTGSATPTDDVRRHTGAGRFSRLPMRPMSLFEIGESDGSMSLAALFAGERPQAPAGAISVRTFAELVVRGGWPLKLPLAIKAAAKANRDYLKTIAEVDFDRVGGARRDPNRVMRFFRALGRNVAMELKVARIAAEVHGDDARSIARSTAYDYLNNF